MEGRGSEGTMKHCTPKILAHRGANGFAPENTIPALAEAARRGADGVEFDVQMTADGELVICHDTTVDRVSDGSGAIADQTLVQLRTLDIGSWFDPAFAGTRIPTLKEALLCVAGMEQINIELKRPEPARRAELVKKTLHTVEELGLSDKVLYSSFDLSVLDEIKRRSPESRCGILYSFRTSDVIRLRWFRTWTVAKRHHLDALNPCFNYCLSPGYRRRCHRHGLEIYVWGIPSARAMKWYRNLSVDGIITDHL